MEKKEFKPFIPANKVMPELTVTSTLYCGGLAAMAYAGSEITGCTNSAKFTINGKTLTATTKCDRKKTTIY